MARPQDFRETYSKSTLSESDLLADPINMMEWWWNDAWDSRMNDPNAMTLATCDASGQPHARTVLFKGFSASGIAFYTNYESAKAREIEENNRVSLLIFWKEFERQIRIEGVANKMSAEESLAYFQSRPRGSQVGAWASPQSRVIPDRKFLTDEASRVEEKFKGEDVLPLPPHWGGYLVTPHLFEFWQGRQDRLHDRFQYRKEGDGWVVVRLAP